MDSSIIILIIIAICAWLFNFFLGFLQTKNFNENFIELRKKGKVAVGRKKGFIRTGAIVLLLLNDDGMIIEGKQLRGTSSLARVRNFNILNNIMITDVDTSKIKVPTNLKKSIIDAQKNYNEFNKGE